MVTLGLLIVGSCLQRWLPSRDDASGWRLYVRGCIYLPRDSPSINLLVAASQLPTPNLDPPQSDPSGYEEQRPQKTQSTRMKSSPEPAHISPSVISKFVVSLPGTRRNTKPTDGQAEPGFAPQRGTESDFLVCFCCRMRGLCRAISCSSTCWCEFRVLSRFNEFGHSLSGVGTKVEE